MDSAADSASPHLIPPPSPTLQVLRLWAGIIMKNLWIPKNPRTILLFCIENQAFVNTSNPH